VGGAGYVSTVANVAPDHLRAVLDAFDAGDTALAARLQQAAIPLVEAVMASGLPGTVTVKALLTALGLPAGPPRPPLRPADGPTPDGLGAAAAALVSGGRHEAGSWVARRRRAARPGRPGPRRAGRSGPRGRAGRRRGGRRRRCAGRRPGPRA